MRGFRSGGAEGGERGFHAEAALAAAAFCGGFFRGSEGEEAEGGEEEAEAGMGVAWG